MSWQDDPVVDSPAGNQSWQSDPVVEAPGKLESLARGAANNVPLLPQAIAGVAEPIAGELGLTEDKGYSQNLADWNQKAAEARKANPWSYGTGSVIGAVGPAFIPGVSEAMAASPLASGAALGAAGAVSNEDLTKNPKENLGKAVEGAGMGAATSGIMNALAPYLTKQFATAATSPEAVEAVTKNPDLLNSPDPTEMAQNMPKTIEAIEKKVQEGADKARSLLSSSYYPPDMGTDPQAAARAISKEDVSSLIAQAKKELGVGGGGLLGSAAKKAANVLDDLNEDVGNIGKNVGGKLESVSGVPSIVPKRDFLPETTVKDILQRLDDNINWEDKTGKVANQALENVRVALDTKLKAGNPAYAEAMKPVDEGMRLLQAVRRTFPVSEGTPKNITATTIANALKDRNLGTQKVLEDLKNYGIADLKPQLLAQQFRGPTPENPLGPMAKIGGRVAGTAIGGAAGGGLGGLGGLMLGRMLAKPMSTAARELAGKAITNPEAIQAGAARGSQAMIALENYLKQLYGKRGNQ